jgi:hypothetical protein
MNRLLNIMLIAGAAAVLAAATLSPGQALANEAGSFWSFGSKSSITGSGNVVSQARNVGDFQAIAVQDSIELVVRPGAKTAVDVKADDNLQAVLETIVQAGSNGPTLMIRFKRDVNVRTRTATVVTVDVTQLRAIAASGSGAVTVERITTPQLKLSLSGSGNARLTGLQTDDFSVSIAGSGDVRGDGKAAKLSLSIAGSGDIKLADMASDVVSVSIAGSGDAAVQAQKALSVSIAGSGDVTYRGDAQVKTSIAGSGRVNRAK